MHERKDTIGKHAQLFIMQILFLRSVGFSAHDIERYFEHYAARELDCVILGIAKMKRRRANGLPLTARESKTLNEEKSIVRDAREKFQERKRSVAAILRLRREWTSKTCYEMIENGYCFYSRMHGDKIVACTAAMGMDITRAKVLKEQMCSPHDVARLAIDLKLKKK